MKLKLIILDNDREVNVQDPMWLAIKIEDVNIKGNTITLKAKFPDEYEGKSNRVTQRTRKSAGKKQK